MAVASLLVAAAITITIVFAVAIASPLPPGFFALGFLAALAWTG